MKMLIMFTNNEVGIGKIVNLLQDASKKAFRTDSVVGNGFVISTIVTNKSARPLAKKMIKGGVNSVYVIDAEEVIK